MGVKNKLLFTSHFFGSYSIEKNTSWLLISTIDLTGCTDYFDSPCTGLTVIFCRPTLYKIPKIFLSQRYNAFLICDKMNRKRQRKVWTPFVVAKGIVMSLQVRYSTFWLLILFYFLDEFDTKFIKIW